MTLYRYKAIADPRQAMVSGEISAESQDAAIAQLRHRGLRPVETRQVRPLANSIRWYPPAIRGILTDYARSRRGADKAELLESLVTLQDCGSTLEESLLILSRSGWARRPARRQLLLRLADQLRNGTSFSSAVCDHKDWFDEAQTATLRAGEHGGDLTSAMRSLARRVRYGDQVGQKVVAAMAYPAMVLVIGVGVVVFLSTRTLPEIVQLLGSANVETPTLTAAVMTTGQLMAAWGPMLAVGLLVSLPCSVLFFQHIMSTRGKTLARLALLLPNAVRSSAAASVADIIAELLRCGVPLTEAMRVTAKTSRGLTGRWVGSDLVIAADLVEGGSAFSVSLAESAWFDGEFIAIAQLGEASGELGDVLKTLALRRQQRTERLVDRTMSLLEPSLILLLAVLVGTVVMAAVLPLIRLQEAI